jgi:hypothetical protein
MENIFHFKANKVDYRNGKLMRLVYFHNKITAKILSDIQYYKYINNVEFEVTELNKKRIIKY